MGWKSTIKVKRKDARRVIREHLRQLSDDALSNVLEVLVDELAHQGTQLAGYYGHNYHVSKSGDLPEDPP